MITSGFLHQNKHRSRAGHGLQSQDNLDKFGGANLDHVVVSEPGSMYDAKESLMGKR